MVIRWRNFQHSTFAAVVMAIVGVGAAVWAVMFIRPYVVSYVVKDWPTTPATVQEGQVVDTTTMRKDGPNNTFTTVNIRYIYRVDGVEYTGTRFTPNGDVPPDADGLEVLRKVKLGEQYPVHYNPSSPGESYFYANYKPFEPMTFICSGCPLSFGIGLVAYGVLMRRRSTQRTSPIDRPREGE